MSSIIRDAPDQGTKGPGSSRERRGKRLRESLKILIANPGHRISVDDRLERYFFLAGGRAPWSIIKHKKKMPRYSTFPFFLAYTAALLERDGFEVQAVDAVPLNLTSEETERRERTNFSSEKFSSLGGRPYPSLFERFKTFTTRRIKFLLWSSLCWVA